MATILIDGQEHTLPEGEALNAIQAAQRVGVEIPYYCWHPALSVVANCRMCEIEVGSKDPKTGEIKMVPKLVPGCQTPAKDGTVLVTDSPKVLEHRRMVMEYLLANHPLDCPVCDQAGECGLQDYSYDHGQANHRFVEERTVNPPKTVSSLVQLNQDRCIMCTRCVRFTREITGTNELQVRGRGHHAEIDIFPGRPLDNPLAGNVVDLCPVGALLDRDFLHKQRSWFLTKHDTVCARCSTGCNMSSEENRGALWRHKPRANPQVNDFWICDAGRYSYKAANDPGLLGSAYLRANDDLSPAPIDVALKSVAMALAGLAGTGGKAIAVLSPFLTVEEAYLLASYIKGLDPANVVALGPVPVEGEDWTISPTKAGRGGDVSFVVPRPFTIHAEKCPNRRGVSLVLEHFEGKVVEFAEASRRIVAKEFAATYIASDAIDPWIGEAESAAIRGGTPYLVVQDTTVTPLAQLADAVIAGATFAEKAGCYVNADGRIQYSSAALPPRDGALPDLDVFAILLGRAAAPIRSGDVLAELARAIPAFAVAAGGRLPEHGLPLEGPEAKVDPPTFRDAWTEHRGAQVHARVKAGNAT